MFAKCLPYPFRHKEVEGGNSLSAVLLVLVCLEYDGGQSGITLNGLWSTDTSVFSAEAAFEQVIQVILDTSGSLGGIVIQIMYMYVAQLMCFGIFFRQQVFIGIIFSNFRGKSHHLSGGSMAGHVGITQVDIIFVDGYNAVHDVLHLRFTVAFRIPPFAINNIFLGHFGTYFHQFLFYQILNLFHTDGWRYEIADNPHGNFSNQFVFIVNSGGMECLANCIFNFTDGKVFPLSITLNNTNLSVIHCLKN